MYSEVHMFVICVEGILRLAGRAKPGEASDWVLPRSWPSRKLSHFFYRCEKSLSCAHPSKTSLPFLCLAQTRLMHRQCKDCYTICDKACVQKTPQKCTSLPVASRKKKIQIYVLACNPVQCSGGQKPWGWRTVVVLYVHTRVKAGVSQRSLCSL